MSGIRSVTLATDNLNQTIELFHHTLGLNYKKHHGAIQFGDGNISPGTRIQFVEIPQGLSEPYRHFDSIGLRTPSNEGLEHYADILNGADISFSEPSLLNGHAYFEFTDDTQQTFSIFSNEHNSGVGLGMPYEDSSVNPLHQIQGLGPIVIKTNELMVTFSMLTQVFGFTPLGEYTKDHDDNKVVVLHLDEGGLGTEVHLYTPSSPIKFPEVGIVEQIEFTARDEQHLNTAIKQLELNELPYQQLKNEQDKTRAIRINDVSGMSFILTLDES
ncbi:MULTISPECIES: lactoylglutathione lyase [Staphylococcus]|uniref:lactoylglutathione lyase n=1 Tax=Staphylococcus TaxID=1279 RepID=UPI000D1BA3BD|nr:MULTISPECIES: lactoylglutathione lyase [Staphylococcus]NHM74711.1 VOC family protein [Staphylococcus sp. 11007852]NJH84771.1 VOC family protein [Staphylococcus agnetis]NJH87019.1 VOC family protein [Staphylococcus agnetis]NJI16691.1 VOC family protein [Staphylococcus agnetis]PTH40238.1 lactoylglutathione lyase [Staphylococcus agnetis]